MKKFKTQKEILLNPETKILLFQFFQETGILNDEQVELKVDQFIERKLNQLKLQGI